VHWDHRNGGLCSSGTDAGQIGYKTADDKLSHDCVTQVHHSHEEMYGSKHVCKYEMHEAGKCGCECYDEGEGFDVFDILDEDNEEASSYITSQLTVHAHGAYKRSKRSYGFGEQMCQGGKEYNEDGRVCELTCADPNPTCYNQLPIETVARCECPDSLPLWDAVAKQCVEDESACVGPDVTVAFDLGITGFSAADFGTESVAAGAIREAIATAAGATADKVSIRVKETGRRLVSSIAANTVTLEVDIVTDNAASAAAVTALVQSEGDSTQFITALEAAFQTAAASAALVVPGDFGVNAVSPPTSFETPTTPIHNEPTEEEETGSYEDFEPVLEPAAPASPTGSPTMVPHACATCAQVPCGQCQAGCPVSPCEDDSLPSRNACANNNEGMLPTYCLQEEQAAASP
jgi:hypothetical protein